MNAKSNFAFKRKESDQTYRPENRWIAEMRSERRSKRKKEREDFITIQNHNIVKMKIYNGNDMTWKMTSHEKTFLIIDTWSLLFPYLHKLLSMWKDPYRFSRSIFNHDSYAKKNTKITSESEILRFMNHSDNPYVRWHTIVHAIAQRKLQRTKNWPHQQLPRLPLKSIVPMIRILSFLRLRSHSGSVW